MDSDNDETLEGSGMSTGSATRRRIRALASSIRVVILDDEWSIRELLEDFLDEHLPGAQVQAVPTASAARQLLEGSPFDIILTDLGLPDANGVEVVGEFIRSYPELTVIVITGRGDAHDAIKMFRQGVYDFITKPIDLAQLGVSIDRAIGRLRLTRENELLKQDQAQRTQLPHMAGSSPQMLELARNVRLIASRDNSVLIMGESGTGKELVARAIHDLSPRAKGPFVPVNVAAIPETLLEAECFGYGKNSGVSGAPAGGRPGMFEAANGGTLFLDEIGDMPIGAQVKVLRALQEREVIRIGTTKPVPIDIRVVCATHQDLDQAVEERRFREDLYFRLNGFPIEVPPLRDRPEDIPLLAQHFLDEFSAHEPAGTPRKVFAPDAIRELVGMNWPGNVREIKSRVERLAITCPHDVIRAADLAPRRPTRRVPLSQPAATPAPVAIPEPAAMPDFATATRDFERSYVLELLMAADWNVTHAADKAGLSRTYIHRLMRKHAIERPS